MIKKWSRFVPCYWCSKWSACCKYGTPEHDAHYERGEYEVEDDEDGMEETKED